MGLVLISQVGKTNTLYQDWQTYGTHAQNVTWKDLLGMRHSLLSQLYFFCLTRISMLWRICLYICLTDCIEIVYELLLLPNSTMSVIFLHKLRAVWSVDWIFITGATAWQWQSEHMTLDKIFYNILFKQEVIAVPFTSTFSSLLH